MFQIEKKNKNTRKKTQKVFKHTMYALQINTKIILNQILRKIIKKLPFIMFCIIFNLNLINFDQKHNRLNTSHALD